MNDFTGKLVLITGAGGGIGRATALRFAKDGARVIAVDVSGESAEETAGSIRSQGGVASAHAVDVGEAAAMDELAQRVRTEHGVLDVLVNNAGIGVAGRVLDTSLEEWQRVIGVNLWGVIHGCRLFCAQMVERARGGHVVNVASAAAFHPSRILPAYATTKAAVLMFSECLRVELAEYGIGVSVICPGLINTGIVRSTLYVGTDPAEAARRREAAMRLYRRRNYGPERVADHIVSAVRRNRAVVPVTPEAHAIRLVGRLTPGLARVLARFEVPGAR